jgi:hypothetical protein
MEAAATVDLSADAIDVALSPCPLTPPQPSPSRRQKVKKEWTTTEREVQNQKRQACRVAEQARKAEELATSHEEGKAGAPHPHARSGSGL